MDQGEFIQTGMWIKELFQRDPVEATRIIEECQFHVVNELHCTLKEVKDVIEGNPQLSAQTVKIMACYYSKMDSYRPKSTN